MALTYGADIYTVSKLLGHTDLKHTQVYAKIVDDKKASAVEAIPGL
jgi:site-specific recombinase XerD